MGDDRRGDIFARWIVKNFPKAKSILDVAGGKGQVARSLANKKRQVHVVDAYPRFAGRKHPLITYQAGWFDEDTHIPTKIDLVVGMHPDEATGEIIRYAAKHRLPFAVVPCCTKGRDAANIGKYEVWIKHLHHMARSSSYDVVVWMLHMNGRNLVIRGIPQRI